MLSMDQIENHLLFEDYTNIYWHKLHSGWYLNKNTYHLGWNIVKLYIGIRFKKIKDS